MTSLQKCFPVERHARQRRPSARACIPQRTCAPFGSSPRQSWRRREIHADFTVLEGSRPGRAALVRRPCSWLLCAFCEGDRRMRCSMLLNALLAALAATSLHAAYTPALAADIPKKFAAPDAGYDYERREVMIPMRDGVRLH